jgi:hypothetical protein
MISRCKYTNLCLSISTIVLLTAKVAIAKNYILEPILDAGVRWDSNYFYTPDNESSVGTWLTQPGVRFGYQGKRTQFKLQATLDGTVYSGREGDIDSFVGYTAAADLHNSPAAFRRLTLGLQDILMYTRNPDLLGELRRSTNRGLYKINRLNPYVEYELDRFRTSLSYENIAVKYDEDGNGDNMLHNCIIKALYKMNRTFEVGPRIKLESMSYDGSTDDYQGLDMGAYLTRNGKFIDIQAGVGYHKREIDDAANSNLNDASWQLGIQSQNTGFRKTVFSLTLLGDINDAVTDDGYYSTWQLKGAVKRKLFKHLELGFNALYAQDDYKLTDREDDIWRIGATAGYTVTSWLKLDLELMRQQRDSTRDAYDYANNSCMIKLSYVH